MRADALHHAGHHHGHHHAHHHHPVHGHHAHIPSPVVVTIPVATPGYPVGTAVPPPVAQPGYPAAYPPTAQPGKRDCTAFVFTGMHCKQSVTQAQGAKADKQSHFYIMVFLKLLRPEYRGKVQFQPKSSLLSYILSTYSQCYC